MPPLFSASGVVILCVVVVVVVVVGKLLLSAKQQSLLDFPSFMETSMNLFQVCYIIAKQLYKCLQWRIQNFPDGEEAPTLGR